MRHVFAKLLEGTQARALGTSLAATAILVPLTIPQKAEAQRGSTSDKMSSEQAREENAYAIGLQAYLWGYPLHEYSRTTPKGI